LEAETVIHIIPIDPELAITKTDGGIQSELGQTVVYTLEVENAGTIDVTGVVVTETLPSGTSFNAGSSTAGWTDQGGGSFQFQIGSMAIGQTRTLSFAVDVTDGSVNNITNVATVGDDGQQGAEANTSNNTATDNTPIRTSTASINGVVYEDANGNGTFESTTENPIQGVAVALSGISTGGVTIQRNATTDANGEYSFQNLPPGTYTVTETQPQNFDDGQDAASALGATQLGTDSLQFTLGEGESESVSFGETEQATTPDPDPVPATDDLFSKRLLIAYV
ncbi:MAG: SdrD B-like domain-containing protein, partial [Planctomycetota bacterium]